MRALAALGGIAGLLLVAAPFAAPTWAGFHDWPYAAALMLCAAPLVGYVRVARRVDGEAGVRLTIACAGLLIVIGAGMASGLLGPDTETVVRAPGVVAPLADVGAAAFFGPAGPDAIARGDGAVVLRRPGRDAVSLTPGHRAIIGATLLQLQPKRAAFVEARDLRGRRLTVTQPTNPSFLSPVLFFPQGVVLAGVPLAADAFSAPAMHRQVKAFFVPRGALPAAAARGIEGDAVLLSVQGEDGRPEPGGIGFALDRREVELGGLRVRVAIGTYPALVISAVPYPPALWAGAVLLAIGLVYALAGVRPATGRAGEAALG